MILCVKGSGNDYSLFVKKQKDFFPSGSGGMGEIAILRLEFVRAWLVRRNIARAQQMLLVKAGTGACC